MAKLLMSLIPANTIASIVAEYITKALSKVSDKEKAAKISIAVSACGAAVDVCGKAVEDCKVTEDEINKITDYTKTAITAIIEAAK